jgi:hypothetical protein
VPSFAARPADVFAASAQTDYRPAGIAALRSAAEDDSVGRRGRKTVTSVESQRELDIYQRPFPTRAADLERSTQGLHPVAEADQARAAGRIDAAHRVVANREVEAVVSLLDRDAYDRRVRVPGRIGQRLRADVVRRHLDRLRQPPDRGDVKLNGDRAPSPRFRPCKLPNQKTRREWS